MLLLYYRPTCPFSRRVLAEADKVGATLEKHDINDATNAAELLARGGRKQVPFLVDTNAGVQMYESPKIVEYLDAHPQGA